MHYRFAQLCTRIQNLPQSANVYVQGVRLIPVGFQTKLSTFFDNEGMREEVVCIFFNLFLSTHWGVLWTQRQSVE